MAAFSFKRHAKLLAVAACAAAFYPSYPASQASELVQQCRNAAAASPARAICSGIFVHAVGNVNSSSPENVNTCWANGSCSVTVAVDDADTTFDWEIPWGDEPLYAGPSDMELLDICFARDDTAEEGWSMDVKTGGCDSDETDAATAKADGLSTEDDDES